MLGNRIWETFRPLMVSQVFLRNFFSMLAIATIASLSLLSVAVYQYEKEGTNQARFSHDQIALRMAREMGLFFEQAHIQVKLTAAYIKDTFPNRSQLNTIMNDLTMVAPHFIAVSLYDSHKTVSSFYGPNPQKQTSMLLDTVDRALNGESWISPVVMDNSVIPLLYMGVPLIRVEDQPMAIIGTLSLRQLWWWIDQINEKNDTTLSIVRDDDGVIIADKERKLVNTRFPGWEFRKMGETILTEEGERYVSYHQVPHVGVTLITTSRRETVSSRLYDVRYQLFFIGAGLLMVATAISFLFAWRSFRPVQELVAAMEKYATGDDTVRVPPPLAGDYGRIGDAFNRMGDEISRHKETLVRQESLVFVGKLAASLAHDMRHGLHLIQNIVYLMQDVEDENRQMLNTAVKDLTKKIEALLEFARSGTMYIDDAYVELIIEETLDAIRYHEISGKVEVKVDNRIAQETVRLDRIKIVSSLGNLMRNAIEAGATRITFTLEEVAGEVRFIIEDNGPGIHDDLQERIFLPFFSKGKKNGFGVGLSIARLIARNHGGDVTLIHTGDEGSAFVLSVPGVVAGKQGAEKIDPATPVAGRKEA